MNITDANKALDGVNCFGKQDLIKITFSKGFFYKINPETNKVETECDQNPKDGWKPFKNATGEYCGDNGHTEKDFNLKIRIKKPFDMGTLHYNYLELPVSILTSIKKVKA